jgi:AcrR family transcriptional regulator
MQTASRRALATESQVLDAAFEVFSRYGFARASMSDIAEAAKLSRTSLYNHFKTKEDVFRALSGRINSEVTTAVTTAASTEASAGTRLERIMDAWVSWAFDLLRRSPHGRELIDEKSRRCSETSANVNALFEALVARTIEKVPDPAASGELKVSPRESAQILIAAVKGIIHAEDSPDVMRKRVQQLVAIFVDGIRAGSKAASRAKGARPR